MASEIKLSPVTLIHIYLRYFFFVCILSAPIKSSLFAQSDSANRRIPDVTVSRLFVGPTARSIPEDKGYINLAEIIMPNFGYGITDEIMVRGGFTPFTVSGRVLYFGLASLQVAQYGDLLISGGIILTDFTGAARHWESALYGYGVVSYGNDVAAIHAGFGGGYSGSRESSSAVFMVGGEWQVARTTKIISENWIVSETGSAAFSLGLRIFGRSLAGELGGVIITAQHALKIESVVPWIGLTFFL